MAVHHPYKKVVQRHLHTHRQHQHQIYYPIHPKNWVIYQCFIVIHRCSKYFLFIFHFAAKLRKFFGALYQFGQDTNNECGDRIRSLVLSLVVSCL